MFTLEILFLCVIKKLIVEQNKNINIIIINNKLMLLL